MRRTPLLAVLGLSLALTATACSTQSKVGDDSLKNFKQQSGAPRLGEESPSPSAKPKQAAPKPQVKTVAPQTVATQPTAAAKPAPVRSAAPAVLTVDINGDNTTSTQFNPANAAVYKSTIVKWVNKDTVARAVKSSDGGATFSSPSIPPGGSFSWTANKTGQIQYADATRPYAVASITVRARG